MTGLISYPGKTRVTIIFRSYHTRVNQGRKLFYHLAPKSFLPLLTTFVTKPIGWVGTRVCRVKLFCKEGWLHSYDGSESSITFVRNEINILGQLEYLSEVGRPQIRLYLMNLLWQIIYACTHLVCICLAIYRYMDCEQIWQQAPIFEYIAWKNSLWSVLLP